MKIPQRFPAFLCWVALAYFGASEIFNLNLLSHGVPYTRNYAMIAAYYDAPFQLETLPWSIFFCLVGFLVCFPFKPWNSSVLSKTLSGVKPMPSALIISSYLATFFLLFSWGLFLANKSNIESAVILQIAAWTGGDGHFLFDFFFLVPLLVSFLAQAIWLSPVKSIQLNSLVVILLPVMVYAFDRGEMNHDFTGASFINLTNWGLLVGAIALFIASTLALYLKGRKSHEN